MTPASPADWEMAIVLPLGAVLNQLQRIESQLRLLNMKALDFARDGDNPMPRSGIDARLEQISDVLGSVARLVADIGADIAPPPARARLTLAADAHPARADEAREVRDHTVRRSRTDWDD